jgi:Flp pilus assembly pilin Flp
MLERISLIVGRAYAFDFKREDGQTVTEYGLVLAFVAIALVAVLALLHTGITNFMNVVIAKLAALPGSF